MLPAGEAWEKGWQYIYIYWRAKRAPPCKQVWTPHPLSSCFKAGPSHEKICHVLWHESRAAKPMKLIFHTYTRQKMGLSLPLTKWKIKVWIIVPCMLGIWFISILQRSGERYGVLELSSNSSWLLVRSWLFCLQNLPCLLSFWCMRGGSVEVWTKDILYQFMEGQTHFGISWHAKMSLALHAPI